MIILSVLLKTKKTIYELFYELFEFEKKCLDMFGKPDSCIFFREDRMS